jgi:hypothetical protein
MLLVARLMVIWDSCDLRAWGGGREARGVEQWCRRAGKVLWGMQAWQGVRGGCREAIT